MTALYHAAVDVMHNADCEKGVYKLPEIEIMLNVYDANGDWNGETKSVRLSPEAIGDIIDQAVQVHILSEAGEELDDILGELAESLEARGLTDNSSMPSP